MVRPKALQIFVKVGLGISRTNADSQWIQFTTYFIEFFVVETTRYVGSFKHVILTRQTCGQRSSRAAESKRRALGNYFSEQICYMFLISKCPVGFWDLAMPLFPPPPFFLSQTPYPVVTKFSFFLWVWHCKLEIALAVQQTVKEMRLDYKTSQWQSWGVAKRARWNSAPDPIKNLRNKIAIPIKSEDLEWDFIPQ